MPASRYIQDTETTKYSNQTNKSLSSIVLGCIIGNIIAENCDWLCFCKHFLSGNLWQETGSNLWIKLDFYTELFTQRVWVKNVCIFTLICFTFSVQHERRDQRRFLCCKSQCWRWGHSWQLRSSKFNWSKVFDLLLSHFESNPLRRFFEMIVSNDLNKLNVKITAFLFNSISWGET